MIDINTYVDKIFLINLDKDTERLKNTLEEFKKHNITNYERVPGVIVSNTDGYNLFGPYGGCDPEQYRRGSIGCLLAHKKIIETAKERGYKKIIIFEDDIEFDNNFTEKFDKYITEINKIPYWNIVYLGFESWKEIITNKNYNDHIVKIHGGGIGAFAYMINSNIFDYLLINIDYLRCEIDLMYNNLNMKSCIHTYKFIEDIVVQKDHKIVGSNIKI